MRSKPDDFNFSWFDKNTIHQLQHLNVAASASFEGRSYLLLSTTIQKQASQSNLLIPLDMEHQIMIHLAIKEGTNRGEK